MNFFYDFIEALLPARYREVVLGDLHQERYDLERQGGKSQLTINFIIIKSALHTIFIIYRHAYKTWWEEWHEIREKRKALLARLASIKEGGQLVQGQTSDREIQDTEQIPSPSSASREFEYSIELHSLSQADTTVNQEELFDPDTVIFFNLENFSPYDSHEDFIKKVNINSTDARTSKIFEENINETLIRPENQKWVAELFECFRSNSKQTILLPLLYSGKSLFRGGISDIVNDGENLIKFTGIFVENPAKNDFVIAPPPLNTLATALHLGFHLRWNICEKYLAELDSWQQNGEKAIREGLKQIKQSIEELGKGASVRRIGEAPGKTNEARLQESFDSPHDRIIEDNMLEQQKYKNILLRADTSDSVNEIRVALTRLNYLNSIVLEMLIARLIMLFKPVPLEQNSHILSEDNTLQILMAQVETALIGFNYLSSSTLEMITVIVVQLIMFCEPVLPEQDSP